MEMIALLISFACSSGICVVKTDSFSVPDSIVYESVGHYSVTLPKGENHVCTTIMESPEFIGYVKMQKNIAHIKTCRVKNTKMVLKEFFLGSPCKVFHNIDFKLRCQYVKKK